MGISFSRGSMFRGELLVSGRVAVELLLGKTCSLGGSKYRCWHQQFSFGGTSQPFAKIFAPTSSSREKSSWHASCIRTMKSTFWWNALKSYPAGEPCLNHLIPLKTSSSAPLKKKNKPLQMIHGWWQMIVHEGQMLFRYVSVIKHIFAKTQHRLRPVGAFRTTQRIRFDCDALQFLFLLKTQRWEYWRFQRDKFGKRQPQQERNNATCNMFFEGLNGNQTTIIRKAHSFFSSEFLGIWLPNLFDNYKAIYTYLYGL